MDVVEYPSIEPICRGDRDWKSAQALAAVVGELVFGHAADTSSTDSTEDEIVR